MADVKQNIPKKISSNISSIPYSIKVFSFMAVLGIVVKFIFVHTSSDYANATIAGYSFSLGAIIGLLITSLAIAFKPQFGQGPWVYVRNMIANMFPILLLGILLTILIVQTITYSSNINDGKVAPEFYQFSGVSSFLILVQIALVIKFLMNKLSALIDAGTEKGKIEETQSGEMFFIYLIFSVLNLFIIGILQVILQYFSTDG